jgi:hypothetical protein
MSRTRVEDFSAAAQVLKVPNSFDPQQKLQKLFALTSGGWEDILKLKEKAGRIDVSASQR